MQAVEAINTSVWAMAHHPSGNQIIKGIGFTIGTPENEEDSLYVAEVENLAGYLQDLGLDDNEWVPDGPEGIYDEVTIA